MSEFENAKREAMAELDLFVAHADQDLGSVPGTDGGTLDLPLVPFLNALNELPIFYTKSSCMGHDSPEQWMCLCGCNAPAMQHGEPFLAIEVMPERLSEVQERLAKTNPEGYFVSDDYKSPTGILFFGDVDTSYKDMFSHVLASLKGVV